MDGRGWSGHLVGVGSITFEILVILALLALNGIFAMAEIAVVSSRKGRLRKLAQDGRREAIAALALAESPNRFLATVQIGITLVGILAGAFGGATLAEELTPALSAIGLSEKRAGQVAFGLVVASITYLSLVIGELVPKHLGLSHSEAIAMKVARPMTLLARLAAPLVTFLTVSTEGLLRVFGYKQSQGVAVSEDEVRQLMQEGLRAGSFNRVESRIVHGALELDQVTVRQIMTPRAKVIWLRVDDSHEQIWHKIVVSGHSYFPLYSESRDSALGIVSLKAIYANLAAGAAVEVRSLATPALIVPDTQNAVQLLESFKKAGRHIAMVTDEFGHIVGMVSLHDVMESVLGEIPSADDRAKPSARQRNDGSWLVDASIDIPSLEKTLPGFRLSAEEGGNYQTLAGLLLNGLGRVPLESDQLTTHGYVFEVLDMDGHRVDKVLAWTQPATAVENGAAETPTG